MAPRDIAALPTEKTVPLANDFLAIQDNAGASDAEQIQVENLAKKITTAGITASVTQSQGQQPLTAEVNEIDTVGTDNDVVTLRAAAAGLRQVVINNGANILQIFPASGDNLGQGVDASTTCAAGCTKEFQAYDATNWEDVSGGRGLGNVVVSGTPNNNELATWTDATTQKGEPNLTFDGNILTVVSESGVPLVQYRVEDGAGGSSTGFYKARGSVGAETAVQAEDVLGGYNTYGYDGSAYDLAVSSHGVVADITGGVVAGYFRVRTRDTANSLADRLRVYDAGLFIAETAAASADVAGFGQFWVENTVPCQPMFTDDDGNDAWLVRGTGTPGDNQILVWGTSYAEGDGDFTFDGQNLVVYNPTADGNPTISLGTSPTEDWSIQTVCDSGAQTLDYVKYSTAVVSVTADKGLHRFDVDGTDILDIDDGGINFVASKGISIAGTDILTDAAGTATLSNIDALEATTKATIEAAIATLVNLTSFGTAGTDTVAAGPIEIQEYAHTGNPSTLVVSTNAVTADIDAWQHPYVDLDAATGTVTLTISGSANETRAGTILIKQDGTARDITFAVAGGLLTFEWLGTEPTWTGITVSKHVVVSYRTQGTVIYLSATAEQST